MKTVHELRKAGYQVRVNHYKCKNNFGGATVVEVGFGLDSGSSGVALCNYQDQFNRKRGVRIALGRALLKLGMETK